MAEFIFIVFLFLVLIGIISNALDALGSKKIDKSLEKNKKDDTKEILKKYLEEFDDWDDDSKQIKHPEPTKTHDYSRPVMYPEKYREPTTTRGNGGHTKDVWKRKGFIVKKGETPSYRYYGRDIYTPDQVYRKGYTASSCYEELNVDNEYGLSENQKKSKNTRLRIN